MMVVRGFHCRIGGKDIKETYIRSPFFSFVGFYLLFLGCSEQFCCVAMSLRALRAMRIAIVFNTLDFLPALFL